MSDEHAFGCERLNGDCPIGIQAKMRPFKVIKDQVFFELLAQLVEVTEYSNPEGFLIKFFMDRSLKTFAVPVTDRFSRRDTNMLEGISLKNLPEPASCELGAVVRQDLFDVDVIMKELGQ